jgi:hypothetical protein
MVGAGGRLVAAKAAPRPDDDETEERKLGLTFRQRWRDPIFFFVVVVSGASVTPWSGRQNTDFVEIGA